ncbi:MAG: hypothetical protein LAC69_01945 [Chlorobium sp.]|jgi:hypothetical protein|nr:hypothetical protein [Chlorobium sp.]
MAGAAAYKLAAGRAGRKRVSLLAHIPLFAVLTALIASSSETIRNRTQVLISAFLVIHGVLHVVFMSQEQKEPRLCDKSLACRSMAPLTTPPLPQITQICIFVHEGHGQFVNITD